MLTLKPLGLSVTAQAAGIERSGALRSIHQLPQHNQSLTWVGQYVLNYGLSFRVRHSSFPLSELLDEADFEISLLQLDTPRSTDFCPEKIR
jgi:hypothetical protein